MHIPLLSSESVAQFLSIRATAQNGTSNGRVGWVSAGDGRSTSDILWSCFSILLVCTWKCIHFNVPSTNDSEAGWYWWGPLRLPQKRLLFRWIYKITWMVGIFIAPEIGVTIAMDQYLCAKEGVRYLKEKEEKSKVEEKNSKNIIVEKDAEWKLKELQGVKGDKATKTHTFFANMGGFVAKIWVLSSPGQGITALDNSLPVEISQDSIHSSTLKDRSLYKREYCYRVRNYEELEKLLATFPDLRLPQEENIQDLSKADVFTKVFACVQSIWLIVQSIARASQGLPITQLELSTMAFVMCALIMYLLWWDKPFGVEQRIVLIGVTYKTTEEEEALRNSSGVRVLWDQIWWEGHDYKDDFVHDFGWDAFVKLTVLNLAPDNWDNTLGDQFKRLLRHLFGLGRSDKDTPPRELINTLTLYAAGTLFSAFHIGAWNWEFPSPTSRTLWRAFAVTATGAGPFSVLLIIFYSTYFVYQIYKSRPFFGTLYIGILILMGLMYTISRLALLVLIFYCFSSMPVGVYETVDWTKFLPHFA